MNSTSEWLSSPIGRRRAARAGLFGALIAALATLPWLGVGTLWDNSETAYGEIVRELMQRGDAIILHFNGRPWFVHPPLYFWIAACCADLFHRTTFALRLPSAIATILMSAVLGAFVARRLTTRPARYAGVILATMLLQAILGRLALMDALLDAALLGTTTAWARAIMPIGSNAARGGALIVGAIVAGLGVLAKGPIAVLLPLLILIPWALWERGIGGIVTPPRRAMPIAVAAFCAIVAPWYLAVTIAGDGGGIAEHLLHYTFGRYVGTIENQTGPIWYYLPVALLGVFPWTGYLIAALWRVATRRRLLQSADTRGMLTRLSLCWLLVPLIFFSFAQTKLPSYLAPALPGAAILIALWLDEALLAGRRRALLVTLTLPVFLALVLVGMQHFATGNHLGPAFASLHGDALTFVCLILGGALVTGLTILRRSSAPYAPFALVVGMIAAYLYLAGVTLPKAEAFKPIPPLATVISRLYHAGDFVAIQGVSGENALLYYATQPPLLVLDSPNSPAHAAENDPALLLCQPNRVFLVGPTERPNPDPTYGRRRRVLARAGKDTLFLFDGPGCAMPTERTTPRRPRSLDSRSSVTVRR